MSPNPSPSKTVQGTAASPLSPSVLAPVKDLTAGSPSSPSSFPTSTPFVQSPLPSPSHRIVSPVTDPFADAASVTAERSELVITVVGANLTKAAGVTAESQIDPYWYVK